MSYLRRRWINNSLANLIGGVATAAVNILLPALVVKHFSTEAFSVWNLSLQLLVYVNLLSAGLQTATARAVAHAGPHDNSAHSPAVIVRAARSISRWAAGCALVLVLLLAAGYPLLFPGVPSTLVVEFRLTLLFFGFAAVVQILAQVYLGIFQGLHRNVVLVGVQIAVRLLTLMVVWVGVLIELPLVALAALMAFASTLLWPAMLERFNILVPWAANANQASLDKVCRQVLLKYCSTLFIWSVSMLLVNAVGIIIVGRVNFPMVGPYAIAMTATSVLVGLVNAALAPLMTTTASMFAKDSSRQELPALLLKCTIGTAIALNLVAIFVEAQQTFILQAWVGEAYANAAAPILIILVGAHCLRNICAPYSLMLLAVGLHRRALASALFEGVANLIASVVMGTIWGAIGVAFDTLFSAAIGVTGTFLFNARHTPELTPNAIQFAFRGLILPTILFMPIHVYYLMAFPK